MAKIEKHICSFCGKEYEDLRDRIRCEYQCLDRIEMEEKKEKERKEKEQQRTQIAALEEQIKLLADNEKSLYNEYLSTISKKKELQKKVSVLKYGENYTKITGFPFDFFLF